MSVKYLSDAGAARFADHLKSEVLIGTLYGGSSWTAESTHYSQVSEITGLKASDIIIVQNDQTQMSISDMDEMENDKIRCIAQGNGELTFIAEKVPSFNIPLKVLVIGAKGSSGGSASDASLESAVTANMTVGAITSGTTLPQGTTFTEFAQKLLITEIAPTTSFSASGSGIKEVGTSVTPALSLTISDNGTGIPVAIKFYSGSTLLDTQSYVSGTTTYTYTTSAVTTTTTVKGVLEYKKSDNTNATVEKSATYTFVMASYYGAVSSAPTDKSDITSLTKSVKNTKSLTTTFNLSNQRSCYCYPASFGNLSSIKDANNFEYLSSYTKTNVTVDEVSYNVYTLTDPVTASSFKQVYS